MRAIRSDAGLHHHLVDLDAVDLLLNLEIMCFRQNALSLW